MFFFTFLAISGPGGLQWSDWAYLAFQVSFHPYLCTCKIRKQYDNNFLSFNPKYDLFFIFGGSWGPLRQTQGYFRAVRPHHRADICTCITREQIITSFSYMGHNVIYFYFWLIGEAWVALKLSDWAHLASQLSSHLIK